MRTDKIYPYKTHDGLLHMKITSDPDIKMSTEQDETETSKSFNLYDRDHESFNFTFEVTCPPSPLYDVVVNINSRDSLSRLYLKARSNSNNKYLFSHNFDKKDWAGDVFITAFMVLKNDRNYQEGESYKKGSRYAESEQYLIRFSEPKERSGSGPGIKPKWIDFKTADGELSWLKKYKDQLYAIDYLNLEKKLPRIYLNENMPAGLQGLLKNKSVAKNKVTMSRTILLDRIVSEISLQMLTLSLAALREEKEQDGWENAWEALEGTWYAEILLSSYKILNIPLQDYKDVLFEIVKNELKYKSYMRKLPNIVQEHLGTIEQWDSGINFLNKKGKK